jgi:hypothetical protein
VIQVNITELIPLGRKATKWPGGLMNETKFYLKIKTLHRDTEKHRVTRERIFGALFFNDLITNTFYS